MGAMKRIFVMALAAVCLVVEGPHGAAADSEHETVIRYATLAPSGSTFGKILKAWSRTLSEETDGRVRLRYYPGGSQGDERDFIRKIRAGQMDAAGVTATGLGIVVPAVRVLSAPGLIETYDELERVREQLTPRFEQMFRDAGFELLAWSDAGKGRIMSTKPILKPSDLRSARPWVWKDDPIFAEFLKVVGANGVRLGVPEVYAALQTKMVDVVPSSAIGAIALQWYTKLDYMSKDSFGIVMGASIVGKEKFDALAPEDQKALKDTARRAGRALDRVVRRDDAKAYRVLVERGIDEVDVAPYRAQWEKAGAQTRERLTGRIFSKSLLQEVEAIAKGRP